MSLEEVTFGIADSYGVALANVECAHMLRHALEAVTTGKNPRIVVLDFERVLTMSIAFADIALADYVLKHGMDFYRERVRITNASESVLRSIDRCFAWYKSAC